MRLTDDDPPTGPPVEHDPASYFHALVALQRAPAGRDAEAVATDPNAPTLTEVFRDASRRAARRIAEARRRLAA